jgi:hypothetical protein
VADLADGFLFFSTIKRLGVAVPRVYYAPRRARDDALGFGVCYLRVIRYRFHSGKYSNPNTAPSPYAAHFGQHAH